MNGNFNNMKCLLYDRDCIDCGECDLCALNPEKRCDNCMQCVRSDADYSAIIIERVIDQPPGGDDAP